MRPLVLAGLGLAAMSADLGAQALDGRIGHYYEGAGWTLYRLGLSTRLGGAFGLAYHGSYMNRDDGQDGVCFRNRLRAIVWIPRATNMTTTKKTRAPQAGASGKVTRGQPKPASHNLGPGGLVTLTRPSVS